MRSLGLVLCLVLGIGLSLSAAENAHFSADMSADESCRPSGPRDLQASTKGSARCNTEHCIYRVKNYPGSIPQMISEASLLTFGDSFPMSQDNIIREMGSSEIFVKLNNEYRKQREEFLRNLQLLDVLDVMCREVPEIKLKVVIYSLELSEADIANIGISNTRSESPNAKAGFSFGSTNSANLEIPINIWQFAQSVLGITLDLTDKKIRSPMERTIEFPVPNGQSLGGTGVIVPKLNKAGSGATQLEKKDTGISLSGVVNINRDGTKVMISGFSLRYVRPIDNAGENYISEETVLPPRNLQLRLDEPKVIWQRTEEGELDSTERNWLFSRASTERRTRLVNIITVTASLVERSK